MWCWTGDGLGQRSGMKTATKHKIKKNELRKKQEKKETAFSWYQQEALYFSSSFLF